MSNTHEIKILEALERIELELRALKMWSDGANRPEDRAFLSETPFFLDTMEFEQWLEFVLIPRLTQMLKDKNLPKAMSIHTYAEVLYREKLYSYRKLISALKALDDCFIKA